MNCNYDHLKAPILELGPAAAHVCCVLPDHLGVVADAPAALLARPGTTNIASLQSEHAEYNICKYVLLKFKKYSKVILCSFRL